jgi:hypothetical protein
MSFINVKRFGLAFGTMCALFYLGCVIVMTFAGREHTVIFFNSILHGIDVTSIIRMNMPFGEMIMGVIEVFILGWLAGATIASVYNFSLTKDNNNKGE